MKGFFLFVGPPRIELGQRGPKPRVLPAYAGPCMLPDYTEIWHNYQHDFGNGPSPYYPHRTYSQPVVHH